MFANIWRYCRAHPRISFAGGLFSLFGIANGLEALKFQTTDKVAVIKLEGVIEPRSRHHGSEGSLYLHKLLPYITAAFSAPNVKAVALVINSPGGSPVQASLIANRIIYEANKKSKIPVVAFVEDVAASGGYYLACAADEIFVQKSSIVGSIGVISAGFGMHKMIEKLGIDRRSYTAGTEKNDLDSFQPEDPVAISRLHSVLDGIHREFIDFVKSRRGDKLSKDDGTMFTGRFWRGEDAVPLGLVDGVGTMHEVMKHRYGDKVAFMDCSPRESMLDRLLSTASASIAPILLSLSLSQLPQIMHVQAMPAVHSDDSMMITRSR